MKTRKSVSFPTLCLAVWSAFLLTSPASAQAQLSPLKYLLSCPTAEVIVAGVVKRAVSANPRAGAGLIRTFFHDCFALGCDASILLDGPNSEKTAQPNLSLHTFNVIDDAKAALESKCPGVVSCADIVVLAARDAYVALGGTPFLVDLGRRDATVGLASNTGDIPSPFLDAAGLIASFRKKGLSATQMVALSGAHTVGKAQCGAFIQRLYPTVDPTLDPVFAETLKAQCPQGGDPSVVVNLDPTTPTRFDNVYFKNLRARKGVLATDQVLFESASTRGAVNTFATSNLFFAPAFINAFKAMSKINVLTGSAGQIRFNCRSVV